jgi:hypothetical protein
MKDKKRIIALSYQHLITAETPANPQQRNFGECPCPKKCTLHGECHLCVAYHGRKKKLPRCER